MIHLKLLLISILFVNDSRMYLLTNNNECQAAINSVLIGNALVMNLNNLTFLAYTYYLYKWQELPEYFTVKLGSYVIYFEDIETLQNTTNALKNYQDYCKASYILLTNNAKIIDESLQSLWDASIHKCVLFHQDEIHTINFDQFRCDKVLVKTVHCRNFIPNFDVKNCMIKIGWFKRPPYIIDPYDRSNSGFYANIIRSVADIYNLTLHFNPPCNDYIEDFYQTGDTIILAKEFQNNITDISLHGVGTVNRFYSVFDQTVPTHRDTSILLVPKPQKIQNWKRILFIFPMSFWLLILCVIIILVIFIALKMKETDRFKIFLFVLQINLGNSVSLESTQQIRLILVFILFYAMILIMYVQGKFCSMETVPLFEKPVTLDEVTNTKYKIIMQYGGYVIMQILTNTKFQSHHYTRSSVSMEDDMENFFNGQNFITLGQTIFLTKYPVHRYDMIVLVHSYAAINVKHCFYLLPQIDRTIHHLYQGGFVPQWLKMVSWTYATKSVARLHEEKNYEIVKLINISPGLYILFAGYCLSIVIFIAEFCIYNRKRVLHIFRLQKL